MRAGSGGLSMRAFVGSQVFALAVDDSEHQVQVTYYTQFKKKTVREVVDVLVFRDKVQVLDYRLEPAGEAPE